MTPRDVKMTGAKEYADVGLFVTATLTGVAAPLAKVINDSPGDMPCKTFPFTTATWLLLLTTLPLGILSDTSTSMVESPATSVV